MSSKAASRRRGLVARWRELLSEFRSAYESGDVASLRALWYRARREPLICLWIRLCDRAFPIQNLLDLAYELDGRMAGDGLCSASRWLLEAAVPGWVGEVPEATRRVLASEPVVIYGNHPSLLTLFLVAAHADRPDLRVISASFLGKFLPGFRPYALPVELPVGSLGRAFLQGGLQRLVVVYWATRLRPPLARPTAKERNRRALQEAIEGVRQGGALLIAPQGWTRREGRWYPGIGVIARALAQEPGPSPAYLVPFREESTSDKLVKSLLQGEPARYKAQAELEENPVRIRFGEPIPVAEVATDEGTIPELVDRLQRRYEMVLPRRPDRQPLSVG